MNKKSNLCNNFNEICHKKLRKLGKPRFVEKLINGNKTLKKCNSEICKFCKKLVKINQKYYPNQPKKLVSSICKIKGNGFT